MELTRQIMSSLAHIYCRKGSIHCAARASVLTSFSHNHFTAHRLLTSSSSLHSSTTNASDIKTHTPGKVRVTIRAGAASQANGAETVKQIDAPVGITLMEAIRDIAKMDIEAACDGTCACSTCHVIFTPASYAKLKDKPSEDEMDMLDLAPSVTDTSRLSCQVQLTSDLDNIEVRIPDEMENQLRETYSLSSS